MCGGNTPPQMVKVKPFTEHFQSVPENLFLRTLMNPVQCRCGVPVILSLSVNVLDDLLVRTYCSACQLNC